MDKNKVFVNRELSWLKFNSRVAQETIDDNNPLLEKLKFVAITSSNMDEFFMVRVAGLKNQLDSGVHTTDLAGLTVPQQLEKISDAAHELMKLEYKYLSKILQTLTEHGLYFIKPEDLDSEALEWLENYFNDEIFPVVTPMAVDASRPFPFLANRSLNLAIRLTRDNGELATAVMQVPGVLPRIIEIGNKSTKDGRRIFVFLEDVIKKYSSCFFLGCQIHDIVVFRITRNADLFLAEEEAEDLLKEVERSLRRRKWGQAVRLEIQKNACTELKNFLVDALKISSQDIYEIQGPIDATCFMSFTKIRGFEHLRYSPLKPQRPKDLVDKEDLFDAIREKDILLHHPYESFEPVIEFVQKAAVDPNVLAIKQTLYRVSGDSPIVKALAQAAENGKQVTVLVELKARFDEEKNILWARRLEEAGCHVIYGLVGLKTHAKITLVVRKEGGHIKRYVHLATGNYNDATAKIYTDMGLFTANDQFGADASSFFNVLSGYSEPPVWNKLVVAPIGLREKIKELIDREISHVKAGRDGHIIAKMNSLIDEDIILKLYEASANGVKIDLIVRGICGLIPGIKNVSENITVRSIVGRFLEHSRIYYFANGGDEKVFLSSADWMYRNLSERVELFFPVEYEDHVRRIKEVLSIMLRDNQKAHQMLSNGTYRKVTKRNFPLNSQMAFVEMAERAGKQPNISLEQKLKPIYRKDN